jgi:hypothetical protein
MVIQLPGEVPYLPMTVLKHQMSHVTRRPLARDRHEPSSPDSGSRDLERND